MPIDRFLPDFDFQEKHKRIVPGSEEEAYDVFMHLDYSESWLLRTLFAIRGLGSGQSLKHLFVILQQDPPHEVILGLIARPWTLKGDVLKIQPSEFISFHKPDYAKIVWSFTFTKVKQGCLVETETRILCTDPQSRKKFSLYWFFIRPFSGLVRVVILSLIAKKIKRRG